MQAEQRDDKQRFKMLTQNEWRVDYLECSRTRIARASVARLRPPQSAPHVDTGSCRNERRVSRLSGAGKTQLVSACRWPAADGYHLLQTAFRFIDYGDELSFAVRADGEIRHDPLPSRTESSLSVRLRPARGGRLPPRRGHRHRQAPANGRRTWRRQFRCRDDVDCA